MKRNYNQTTILILTLSLFSIFTSTQAQQIKNGDKLLIEAGGGISGNGVAFYVGQVTQLNKLYIKANLFYESGAGSGIKYNSYGVDFAAGYRILKIGKSFFINAKGGLTLNVDKLTTPLTEKDASGNTIQNDHNLFKFGVLGGGEAQWKFAKKLSLIVGGDQRYLFGADTWGHVRWLGYAGVRYALK